MLLEHNRCSEHSAPSLSLGIVIYRNVSGMGEAACTCIVLMHHSALH